jgi:sorting nexin-4
MDINDFDDVSWHTEVRSAEPAEINIPTAPEMPTKTKTDRNGKGRAVEDTTINSKPRQNYADTDLAATLDGILECTVDSPQKENDGTKDAYVSYLVTTHVSWC